MNNKQIIEPVDLGEEEQYRKQLIGMHGKHLFLTDKQWKDERVYRSLLKAKPVPNTVSVSKENHEEQYRLQCKTSFAISELEVKQRITDRKQRDREEVEQSLRRWNKLQTKHDAEEDKVIE